MGADPLIEVTLDASEKQLTIHGIDSLGITEEIFLKVMRKLGVSGNLVGSEVGQFGFGFASYTTLSDLVTVLTWARETDEQYAVMGKNGIKFNMLPKPKLEAYGTKLSLTYKKDVEPSQLIENLIQFAKFSKVRTVLIMKNDIEVGKYSRNENWTAYAALRGPCVEVPGPHQPPVTPACPPGHNRGNRTRDLSAGPLW